MTRSIKRLAAALAALLVALAVAPASALAEDNWVAMYRLYNQWTGEHFYTASLEERNTLANVGWTYESVGWFAPEDGIPVYRLYNPYASGGDHHYTMSEAEYAHLQSVGWRAEGVCWYSDTNKSVPVYREYNPYEVAHNHNYTANTSEHDMLVGVGWNDEGIGWYGVPGPSYYNDMPVPLNEIRVSNVPTTIAAGSTCKLAATVARGGMIIAVNSEAWEGNDGSFVVEDTYEYGGMPYNHVFPAAGTQMRYVVIIQTSGYCSLSPNARVYVNGTECAYDPARVFYGYLDGMYYLTIYTDYTVTVQ